MSTDKGVRVWLRRHGPEQMTHPGGNVYSWASLVAEQVVRDAHRALRP